MNITDSTLDKILGGNSGGTNPLGASAPPAGDPGTGTGTGSSSLAPMTGATTTASLAPAWTGLTGAATSGSNMMGSAGGSPRTTGGVSAPGGLTMTPGKLSGGSAVGPPGLPGMVGGASPKETFSKDDRRRFEFVVMLIWREPVPKIEPNTDMGTPTGQ